MVPGPRCPADIPLTFREDSNTYKSQYRAREGQTTALTMRLTQEQQLEQLKQERETLQSELDSFRRAKLNARTQRVRSRLTVRERKTDTRRKILVGAMMLKLSDQHPNIKEFMVKHLDDFLDHPRDRDLFDLPDRPNTAPDGS